MSVAEQYIRVNYPLIAAREAVIIAMPDLRDLRSDWAKREAKQWTIDAIWEAIAGDLDSIGSSEEYERILEALLSYNDPNSNRDMKQKLKTFLFSATIRSEFKTWAALFPYVAYVLLSDLDILPFLLESEHVAMKVLVENNGDSITRYFFHLYEASSRKGPERRERGAVTQKKPLNLTAATWSLGDLSYGINSYEAASVLVTAIPAVWNLMAENDDLNVNSFLMAALFDSGLREQQIINTLLRTYDMKRIAELVKTTEDPIQQYPELLNTLMSCNDLEPLKLLLTKYKDRSAVIVASVCRAFVDAIYDRTRMLNVLKLITKVVEPSRLMEHLDDEEINISDLLEDIIKEDALELFVQFLKLGVPVSTRIEKDGQINSFSLLEYALRTGAVSIADHLWPFYRLNMPDVLLFMMKDVLEDEIVGLRYLLRKHTYSQQELGTAIAYSTNEYKTAALLEALNPNLRNFQYQVYEDPFKCL